MIFFLPWNTKGDIFNDIRVPLFNAITMIVCWSFQASKRTQKPHKILIKVFYMAHAK